MTQQNIGELFVPIKLDMKEFDRQMAGIQGKFQAVGRNLTNVGRTMSMAVTAPLVGIGLAAAKMGANFETEFAKIEGLVGVPREQLDGMREDLLKLAVEAGKSPKELAEALFFVTSAGLRGEEAMEALAVAAKASAAGLGDTATIADAVTSAMNAYGAENLSAARAGDILTAAVREGKLEASALAPVLGRLLPTASAMGIQFEDVAGVLAVMSRTGLDASQSATSLNAVMTALIKPAAQSKEALAGVGLSSEELRRIAAQPGGLIQVMRLLQERFHGNDEELAKVIPNVEAFRGVMNVLAQDAGTVDDVMAGVADSVGVLDNAFDIAGDTANQKFNEALTSMQVALIKIAPPILNAIVPALTKFGELLAKVAEWFSKLDPKLQTATIGFFAVAAAIGPAFIILGSMASGLSALIVLIPKVVAGLKILTLGVRGLAGSTGIGLLILGIVLVIEHFDFIKEKAAQLWNFLRPVFEKGINFLIDLFNKWSFVYREAMAGLLEGAKKVANIFDKDLASGIQTAIDAIRRGVPEVKLGEIHIEKMGDAAETTGEQAGELGAETNTAKDAFVAIAPPIDATAAALDGVTSSAGETTRSVAESTEKLKVWNNEWIKSEVRLKMARDAGAAVEAGTGRLSKVIVDSTGKIKEQSDALDKNAKAHMDAIATANESWDRYKFKVSDIGRFLDEHQVKTEHVLQAIARQWGMSIDQVIHTLTGLQISANDTEAMVKLLGENGLQHLRLIVTGSNEAGSAVQNMGNNVASGANKAGSAFRGFAGQVVSGVNNIKAALRQMESSANSAFAAVGRANNAKIDDTAKGSRGNETGRRGVLNAQIRAINDGLVQLRNNLAREKAGSGNPQAVQRQYDARRKELEAQRDRLVKELRSISTMDTGGLVRGPGLFRVGPGVQEIVRYHGNGSGAGADTVYITLELDGEVIGERLVDLIRARTGMRST